MHLIDSSILIKWLRRDPRAFKLFSSLPKTASFISEITAFETLIGAKSRQQLDSAYQVLLGFERIPITNEVSENAALLVKKYPQIFDRKVAHTLFDSFIAATGIVKDLEIITLNIRHFTTLKEQKLKMRILDEKAKRWV